MEDGQENIIPLDSELDVGSSDMLVSVEEPKFQHNRQKYQGRYLPSSVRFEHDGWAAGDDVYQFNIKEATVTDNGYTVTKYLINNNPTYKMVFRDADGRVVGHVYYIRNSRVKAGNVGSASFESAGVNPVITGDVDGKAFRITYDSVKGTCSYTGTHADLSVSMQTRYDMATAFTVTDASRRINLSFAGFVLPSDRLVNTHGGEERIAGKFLRYLNGYAEWQSGTYFLRVQDSKLRVYDNAGAMVDEDPLTNAGNGRYTGDVKLNTRFFDRPQVTLTEFAPFFYDMTATQVSPRVAQQAAENVSCNLWSVTTTDKEPSRSMRPKNTFLFRNSHVPDGVSGTVLYNQQTVEYLMPVWFGVSGSGGFEDDVTGGSALNVTTAPSVTVNIMVYEHEKRNWQGGNDGWVRRYADVPISFIYNERIKPYDKLKRRPSVKIWECGIDTTEKYVKSTDGWNELAYTMSGFSPPPTFKLRIYYSWVKQRSSLKYGKGTNSGKTKDGKEWTVDCSGYVDMFLPATLANISEISVANLFVGTAKLGDLSHADSDEEGIDWPLLPAGYDPDRSAFAVERDVIGEDGQPTGEKTKYVPSLIELWPDGHPPVSWNEYWRPIEGYKWTNFGWPNTDAWQAAAKQWIDLYGSDNSSQPDIDSSLSASSASMEYQFLVTGVESFYGIPNEEGYVDPRVLASCSTSINLSSCPFCANNSVLSVTSNGLSTGFDASGVTLIGELRTLGNDVEYDDRYVGTYVTGTDAGSEDDDNDNPGLSLSLPSWLLPAHKSGKVNVRLPAGSKSVRSETGTNFWARCCMGRLGASVNIRSDLTLDKSLDRSMFSLAEYNTNYANSTRYVDLSKYMQLQLVSANMQDRLQLQLYVCSKTDICNMSAVVSSLATGDEPAYVVPPYIYNHSLDNKSDSGHGNMICYQVNTDYIDSDVDLQYGISATLVGTPLKHDDNSWFTSITNMVTATDTSGMLDGSAYSEEAAHNIADALKWRFNEWRGYVDLNETSDDPHRYFKSYSQGLSTGPNGTEIVLSYALDGQLPKLTNNGQFTYRYNNENYTVKAAVSKLTDTGDAEPVKVANITYTAEVPYVLDFYVPYVKDSAFRLVSLEHNIAVLDKTDGTIRLTVDFDTLEVLLQQKSGSAWGTEQECDEVWGDGNSFTLTSDYSKVFYAALCGVYQLPDNLSVTSLSNSLMKAVVDGDEVSVDLNTLFDPYFVSEMKFHYTKVNDEELKTTPFASVLSESEFQFLKQQWDTTNETENFWWINDFAVLALMKRALVLRMKTGNVTDWDGDELEDVLVLDRSEYITSGVLKYFCTNAYGGERARFVTVGIDGDNLICIKAYDFFDDMGNVRQKPVMTETHIDVTRRNITAQGQLLCPDAAFTLYTYSALITDTLVSQAVWSGTCAGGYMIIGCHFDNNMNQWAILVSLTGGTRRVIQGYGYVGLDGSLTGGEIPSNFFNEARGFSGAVRSLDALASDRGDVYRLSELWELNDMVVGTDSQQWYICKNVPSIVSHLTFSGGVFTAQHIKINNNYSVDYASASYNSVVFSDYTFKIRALKDMLPDPPAAWTAMLVLWMWPQLYYLDPRISVANYLQQTLGQAAYVHYNSTAKAPTKDSFETQGGALDTGVHEGDESLLATDEITFDRQSVKQEQSTADPYSTTFTMCASALISALDMGQDMLQVNSDTNQQTNGSASKVYTQHFMQNLNSMAISDMDLQSVNPTQTSEVTAIKSLDMFYSTSDKQEVQAGPGFVNHNFVAQCVSQSVTSLKSSYRQQRLLYIISALTMLPIQTVLKALSAARDAVGKQLESMAGPGISFGGVVVGLSFTTPVSIALGIGWAALNVACNIMQIGVEMLPQMITAMGGNRLNSTITALQTKGSYNIEAKHNYGSRSECFMWPCFGVDTPQEITDESVKVITQDKGWKLDIHVGNTRKMVGNGQPDFVTAKPTDSVVSKFNGTVPYYVAMVKGQRETVRLPNNMACVIGTETFLPEIGFRNENISESEPVFPTAPFQDYIIDEHWQLSRTATCGVTLWVGCRDTKIIDGDISNCVVSDGYCCVASPYTAIEVKRGIQQAYLRPWAITPNALAINNTGLNCCFEEKAYHAFDGYGYRMVNWTGSSGLGKEKQSLLYSFLINDRFKRSNKLAPNEFLGNFRGTPLLATKGDYNDKVYVLLTQPGENIGVTAGVSGEDKSARRYALPVFSEFVSNLPAAVKTVTTQMLAVVEGVTSLVTVNRNVNSAYKSPMSVDFVIGKARYRYTREYICSVERSEGTAVDITTDLVPCLGLTYLGSTPNEAYLYSQETRQYYKFTGGSSLQLVDMIERFRNVIGGLHDFVNQEVLLPCVATFDRLDRSVRDDEDETDNVMVARLKEGMFKGEVWPPLDTMYNTRSGFKTLSMSSGVVFQGPTRCIINRFITQPYMYGQIRSNYGRWKKVPKETYHPFREYRAKYDNVEEYIGDAVGVNGWTHNPFLLVTAPIGVSSDMDCMFEWNITFCWPVEMDALYADREYAVVNIQAETMTPGGKVVAERPTHVYLTKELFTRTGNVGYYSFRYQSKCGIGNRERLHIWSDQYVCVSALALEYKTMTMKRTEILTEQLDVAGLVEV